MIAFLRWTAGCSLLAALACTAAVGRWPVVAGTACTWGLVALLLTGPRGTR